MLFTFRFGRLRFGRGETRAQVALAVWPVPKPETLRSPHVRCLVTAHWSAGLELETYYRAPTRPLLVRRLSQFITPPTPLQATPLVCSGQALPSAS